MSQLVEALVAFFQEHRRCGKLDTGIAGNRVWVDCPCGATIVQPIGNDIVQPISDEQTQES